MDLDLYCPKTDQLRSVACAAKARAANDATVRACESVPGEGFVAHVLVLGSTAETQRATEQAAQTARAPGELSRLSPGCRRRWQGCNAFYVCVAHPRLLGRVKARTSKGQCSLKRVMVLALSSVNQALPSLPKARPHGFWPGKWYTVSTPAVVMRPSVPL